MSYKHNSEKRYQSVGEIQKLSKNLKLYLLLNQSEFKMNKWWPFIHQRRIFLKDQLCMRIIPLIVRRYKPQYMSDNNIFPNIFTNVINRYYLIFSLDTSHFGGALPQCRCPEWPSARPVIPCGKGIPPAFRRRSPRPRWKLCTRRKNARTV